MGKTRLTWISCFVGASAVLAGPACLGPHATSVSCGPLGTVYLPGGRTLCVEIADTPEEQARGYMFRESVGEGEGMLFLMGDLDFHPFWMRNCRVSLDIIWMDETWRIVHVAESVPPCGDGDPCPPVVPMQKSLYVLEVAGGTGAALGIRPGATLRYVPPRAQPP